MSAGDDDVMPGATPDELLAAVYAADGPEANRALYARWAATYESGFIVDSGYRYPERVAAVFAERCLAAGGAGGEEAVLDVGCGTGLGGVALRSLGVANIDGLDLSPEMLARAAAKQHEGDAVYRRLIEGDLTKRLPIDDGTYASALSAGTFTHGHVGPEPLGEIVRVVRAGGRCALGINAAHFAAAHFGPALDELVRAGRIAELTFVDVPIYGQHEIDDPDKVAHIAIFTVT